jgi:serine/threonine-protein phosphatase 2A regulatory subunit B
MLALGDRAGRLIVFNATSNTGEDKEYDYHFEFQSH